MRTKYISCFVDKKKVLGKCEAYVGDDNEWVIYYWRVETDFREKGIGKKVLREVLEKMYKDLGAPPYIDYIWDGENEYVYDFLNRHFQPECACPLDNKSDMYDDWISHVYHLNTSKVFEYFNL